MERRILTIDEAAEQLIEPPAAEQDEGQAETPADDQAEQPPDDAEDDAEALVDDEADDDSEEDDEASAPLEIEAEAEYDLGDGTTVPGEELRKGFMRQEDHRRKNSEVAQEKRLHNAEYAEKVDSLNEMLGNAQTIIQQMQPLQQFAQNIVNGMGQMQSPETKQFAEMVVNVLQQTAQNVNAGTQQVLQARTKAAEARAAESERYLKREIRNWNPEYRKELREYVGNVIDMDGDQFDKIDSGPFLRLVADSYEFSKLKQKARQSAPVARDAAKVKSKSRRGRPDKRGQERKAKARVKAATGHHAQMQELIESGLIFDS